MASSDEEDSFLSGVDFFPGDLLSSFYLRLKSSSKGVNLLSPDFYLKTLTLGLGFLCF